MVSSRTEIIDDKFIKYAQGEAKKVWSNALKKAYDKTASFITNPATTGFVAGLGTTGTVLTVGGALALPVSVPGLVLTGIVLGAGGFAGSLFNVKSKSDKASQNFFQEPLLKSDPTRDLNKQLSNNTGSKIITKSGVKPTTISPSTSKVTPLVNPADASNSAKLAKVIKNETIPAMESLEASQTASSLALENNQANIEAVSEAYSGYSNALMGAADSMSYLALTEETVAQKQSVTAGILSHALNEAQASVDNLAGNSLVQLSNAFAGAIVYGRSFGDALKSMGENILYTVIQMQALSWITSLFGFGGSGGMEKFGAFTPSNSILNLSSTSPYGAWGSAISALLPFAKGGIVSKPTLFGFAKGIGLMGEAGAEAIMPLGRDSRGNLGVRVADSAMSGTGTGGVFAPHVEINVENKGGGDMSEEQARSLGTQVKAIVEMQVAKQMYEYMRNGTLRPSMGRGY